MTGDAATGFVELEPDSVAASIFSPPYPNAYEYWLYHKYRMYWLGYDPIEVRTHEIGARPFYSGSGRLTEDDFAGQMQSFRRLLVATAPGGMCFVVVGDSIIRGRVRRQRRTRLPLADGRVRAVCAPRAPSGALVDRSTSRLLARSRARALVQETVTLTLASRNIALFPYELRLAERELEACDYRSCSAADDHFVVKAAEGRTSLSR